MYEDEIYFEEGVKKIELGCYVCPQKLYLKHSRYISFINKKRASK